MNIYCFSTLSFAKLQFKSVINKAFHKHGVASFTDAWIETGWAATMRGKLSRIFYRCVDWNMMANTAMRSFMGRIFYRCVDWNSWFSGWAGYLFCRIFYRCVDWNYLFYLFRVRASKSHLLQMRGLKPHDQYAALYVKKSHLLQMRGLKPYPQLQVYNPESRIFYRCVDWNKAGLYLENWIGCRIFYRCVDWNAKYDQSGNEIWGRIFYRCVDWNLLVHLMLS